MPAYPEIKVFARTKKSSWYVRLVSVRAMTPRVRHMAIDARMISLKVFLLICRLEFGRGTKDLWSGVL